MVVIRRKSDGMFYTHRWARAVSKDDHWRRWTDDLSYARHFFRSCDAKQCDLLYGRDPESLGVEIAHVNLALRDGA